MSGITNDRLIKALFRHPVDKTPVWIMRQAGRYLPEYRQVRAQAGGILTLCKTPELACQVTLQPLARFDLDAAIVFSDILTIPDAMNLGLHFAENEGPVINKPVRSAADVDAIREIDVEHELAYVMDAIKLIKHELANTIPLIGFAGSPWTLATYMIEGGTSKTFSIIKAMLYREPQLLHALLTKVTCATIDYLNAQIKAGADAVMIFDTWGGVLTAEAYREFSLNYVKTILDGLTREFEDRKIPVILFTKSGGQWLEMMADTGCDALGLDWTINIGDAKRRVGDRVALQGNLDPSILYGTPETIQAAATQILKDFGDGPGHVFNLGHGIAKDVDPDNVKVLIDTVRDFAC